MNNWAFQNHPNHLTSPRITFQLWSWPATRNQFSTCLPSNYAGVWQTGLNLTRYLAVLPQYLLGSGKGNVEESVESARRIPPDWSFGGEVSQPGMPNYSHTAQWGTMACLGSTPIRRPLLIFGRDVENATLDHFYFFIRTYHRHPETIATLPT